MNELNHQRIINELQPLINDTQAVLKKFEAAGMDEDMPEDYQKLLNILDRAIRQQRAHTLEMLAK